MAKLAVIILLINLVTVYITNGQTQVFTFTRTNRITDAGVTCGAVETCIVECNEYLSCFNNNGPIVDGRNARNLVISCVGDEYACTKMVIAGPITDPDNPRLNYTTLNITCDSLAQTQNPAWGPCSAQTVYAGNTSLVNIDCVTETDCYGSTYYFYYVWDQATISSYGFQSLRASTIEAYWANHIEINCNFEQACRDNVIKPNLDQRYGTNLNCNDFANACESMQIDILGSSLLPNNFLDLYCAPNTFSACDVEFYCLDISESIASTTMTWVTADQWYWCDDNYATSCCPWASVDDIQKSPTMAPTDEPTTSEPTTASPTPATDSPTPATNPPSMDPTIDPTTIPSYDPTYQPTYDPTFDPTMDPTTSEPTTANPTEYPTTTEPTTAEPTEATDAPTEATNNPSKAPTPDTTAAPTMATDSPTSTTYGPTMYPSMEPTEVTYGPTEDPTMEPIDSMDSGDGSVEPTMEPTGSPTAKPVEDTNTSAGYTFRPEISAIFALIFGMFVIW